MNYPSIDTCQLSCDDRVLEVTLCRPAQGNAFTPTEHQFLHDTWQRFEQDNKLRVAIITGEGQRFFCAGNDIAYALENDELPMSENGFGGLTSWFSREKPIIAAVNGIAAGGGFEIALACDMVVADDKATFSLPEAKVGTYAGAGGLLRLPRAVSEKIAMEMILTGNGISAARAYELGLINAVTADGTALTKARDLAQAIVANSPQSIAVSKRIINQTRNMASLESAQRVSDSWGGTIMHTEEIEEGFKAFVEKRKPDWSKF